MRYSKQSSIKTNYDNNYNLINNQLSAYMNDCKKQNDYHLI